MVPNYRVCKIEKMDNKNTNSDSQGSDEPAPPGTSGFIDGKKMIPGKNLVHSPAASPSSPGMLQAKKKLRAFSIQKKAVLTPITVPKPVSTGNTTVLIGKLSGVKTTPKPEPADPDVKKPPKPPKPGAGRKILQENYTEIQKKNVAEIEDMKRKMELVELGIPLGLICPTSTSEKAMPTKAMPPIKSFLDPAKVDELIREAKKARAEGKNFKFELSKFLPDYDNPFQRKKDNPADSQDDKDKDYRDKDKNRSDRRKSDKYEFKRHTDHRKKDDKDRDRDRHMERSKDRDRKSREVKEEKKDESKRAEKSDAVKGKEKAKSDKDPKETDVNLNDYLVCDSWSLETEDKTNSSSPKGSDRAVKTASIPLPNEEVPKNIDKSKEPIKIDVDIPLPAEPVKVEKLQPVIDSFKYELDSNDDEVLDIFDEDTNIDKFTKATVTKRSKSYDSPVSLKMYDYDQEPTTADDENFLESVINEIKQEDMSDISQDKGLVEYDMSPIKDDDIQRPEDRESVTPELDDRMRDLRSQQSSYSDGYRSSESGYKSRESGYKSDRSESYRLSVEKDLDDTLDQKMSKSTVESLETWSFILKICQPLLFRHDRNKCYKETHTAPKLWYTENPRRCSCVKDRAVVYDELETCKMALVGRVYGCDQIAEEPFPTSQQWYPRHTSCFVERSVPLTNEWETDEQPRVCARGATPRSDEIYLDREYQRFMEAVWPEVSEAKADTSRSTTPVKEMRKKKKADDTEDKKKAKKMKLSSEGWSQESEPEEPPEKSKKTKDKVRRKRKHSVTTLTTESDSEDARKRKKALKRKLSKKTKTKDAKRRRLSKKYLRKLKEKNKKKKKQKPDDQSDDEKEKKKEKKAKKKKLLKQKKTQKKKARTKSTSSSSSSSDSSSESSSDEKRKKKAEKRKKKKEKKRKQSLDSTQSEELFDVNILNNIKTERLTDDEKRMEFSPRRHGEKPREIINVKELQNDFVGNNIHIKQERVEEEKEITPELELPTEQPKDTSPTQTEFKEPEVQPPQQISPPQTTPQPERIPSQELPQPEESSQCSSQESVSSKDHYEKDDSHLRPSSQNSNYSFNDVMASHGYKGDEIRYEKGDQIRYEKGDQNRYAKGDEAIGQYEKGDQIRYPKEDEPMGTYQKGEVLGQYQKDVMGYEKGDEMMGASYQKEEEYEPANYEIYEQMAMAYQSDVASQQNSLSMEFTEDVGWDSQRIETVVGGRPRGEIKCDWRAGDRPPEHHAPVHRPSRWGLKPGEVNIVLTGGTEQYQPARNNAAPARNVVEVTRSVELVGSGEHGEQVYKIESIANRSADSNTSMSYDEAYMDMYGASDRLQYGDCFGAAPAPLAPSTPIAPSTPHALNKVTPTTPLPRASDPRRASSLDARIDLALKNTVLGEVAKDPDEDKDAPEKGILVSKSSAGRVGKRVSFADGYTPGQDSDVEAPPRKKKKVRRYGCAWPCPAEHPDHVPLWDALPPPPPPASPPPPPAAMPPHPALLAALRRAPGSLPPGLMSDPMLQQQLAHHQQKFDPSSSLPPFMPPEPPPGMINFHLNN